MAFKKCVVALTVGVCTGVASADVIITVSEVAGDVVFDTAGTLDLSGATFLATGLYSPGIIPGGTNWYVGPGPGGFTDQYELVSAAGPFGTSESFNEGYSSNTGDNFFIWGANGGTPQVGVPEGYLSGDALNSQLVYASTTIAALTLIEGTYLYELPSSTVTLHIVPAPGAAALLGLAGLVGARRRRRA